MIQNVVDLPWDFVVIGVPRSVQARPRKLIERWKSEVRAAAKAKWPSGQAPLSCKLQIHVTYFHEAAPLDVDNMLKPIQDALIGLVYDDDNQLTDTHGHLRSLTGLFKLQGVTSAHVEGIQSRRPFVHVRIELPSSSGELP